MSTNAGHVLKWHLCDCYEPKLCGALHVCYLEVQDQDDRPPDIFFVNEETSSFRVKEDKFPLLIDGHLKKSANNHFPKPQK